MMATYIKMPDFNRTMKRFGLFKGGKTQIFFNSEVRRVSDRFVPMRQGTLKNNVFYSPDGTYFEYESPYARYQWYGFLMIGKAPKTLTDIPLRYNGAPIRGGKWVERAWEIHREEVEMAVEKYMKGL